MKPLVYVINLFCWLLLTPFVIAETVVGNSPTSPSITTEKSSLAPLASFRTLDEETELLVKEVLNLGSDLAILQEKEDNPEKFQLLVLVTHDKTKLFALDLIQLEIDGTVVAAYQYTAADVAAMERGGSHRLYLANVPAGMHEVNAVMVGRIPRNPDYQREASYKFLSGVSRTVLEFNVSSKSRGYPSLEVKEWN